MTSRRVLLLSSFLALAVALSVSDRLFAQEPPPASAGADTDKPDKAGKQEKPDKDDSVETDTTALDAATTGNPFYKKNGKKLEYIGPHEIVQLAPTPMLDDEGKQRLDPDGKPMFNPPVKQQRDKHGNPAFDVAGKPIMQTATALGYDEKGKKLHVKKEKPPKMTPVSISRGTLTVDGMTGKAALNYDIPDLKYIYLFAPGIGIVVVSNHPFPGGSIQKKAFADNTLTVNVGEHILQLASDKRILSKAIEPAYVMLDREFALPSKFPVMGYGETLKAPYNWPGAKANTALAGTVAPPPPANLLPVQLLEKCPAGQMRMPGPKVLPGQTAPVQPCVPVAKASAAQDNKPAVQTSAKD